MARRPFVAAIGVLTALMIGAGVIGFTTRSTVVAVHAATPSDRQFVVECTWSHRATDDPIVHPGHAGAAHMHDFFGSEATNAASTAESLIGTATTCQTHTGDTAAYWVPTLYADDRAVEPGRLFAYYRSPPGVSGRMLRPYPFGLMMVAGDMAATEPQETAIVGWHCGASPAMSTVPVECTQDAPLAWRIAFPSCWDGERLDSEDHRSHVAYAQRVDTEPVDPEQYGCPASHPVLIPELVMDVVYDFVGDPTGLRLASGSVLTGHADFLNAWDPAALDALVADCLERGVDCGVAPVRATSTDFGAGD